jgi:hypothetical protein
MDAHGDGFTETHIEDISAYDNSVTIGHLRSCQSMLSDMFHLTELEMDLLAYVDGMPIMTCGFSDQRRNGYSLLQREGGIPSGFQLTTAYGTLINLMLKVDILSQSKGVPPSAILSECANFAHVHNRTLRDCKWGILLKGDDVLLFWRRGYFTADAMTAGMADKGFKTDVEPAPLFLMQYIDLTRKMKGSDYVECPASFRDTETFRSHGLAAKRLGNRRIFVEHPLKDIRPARMAIYASLIDLQMHPSRDLVYSKLMKYLNTVDHSSKDWTPEKLIIYIHSKQCIDDMRDYADGAGRNDPYLKELYRRHHESGGASPFKEDSDVLVSDEVMDILESLEDVFTLGIPETIPDTSVSMKSQGISDEGINLSFDTSALSGQESRALATKIMNFLIKKGHTK